MEEASYKIITYKGNELPDNYKAMIFSKWLRSLRYGNDYFKLINQARYYAAYHVYVERLLTESTIRLATLSNDIDVVLGFSVCRGNVLDYVHVQKDYRRIGVGKSLVPCSEINCITHVTRQGMSFWNNLMPLAIFDPFR